MYWRVSYILYTYDLHLNFGQAPKSEKFNPQLIFTRESSYCFQRVLATAILSVHLYVCLSVTQVDQPKTAQARITKSLPSAA